MNVAQSVRALPMASRLKRHGNKPLKRTSISKGYYMKRKGLKVGKGLANDDAIALHLLSLYERQRL